MSEFRLEIITPEKVLYSGGAEALTFKTPQGEIGVLGGHMRLVTLVADGPAKILRAGAWSRARLSPGFAEISPDRTTLLAGTAEWEG